MKVFESATIEPIGITKEPLFKLEPRKLTWKEKLRIKYLNLVDKAYEKLTGHCPYEE